MYRRFKYYSMSDEEKGRVVSIIRGVLSREDKVLLAILFGSFIELREFRDIDLGIYALSKDLKYLTSLATELEVKLKVPVDVVPLDEVSSRFRYYILTKGRVILEKVSGIYEALLMMTLDDLRREELAFK